MEELNARARLVFVMSTIGYAFILVGVLGIVSAAVGGLWPLAWAPIATGLLFLVRRVPYPAGGE